MLHFSTDAWHYKLIDRYNDYPPSKNLCPYFWEVVAAIGKMIAVFIVVGLLPGLFIVDALAWTAAGIATGEFLSIEESIGAIALLIVIGAIFAVLLFIGIAYLFGTGKQMISKSTRGSDIHRKVHNSLVAAKIRAWHEKICPQITFHEPNPNTDEDGWRSA